MIVGLRPLGLPATLAHGADVRIEEELVLAE